MCVFTSQLEMLSTQFVQCGRRLGRVIPSMVVGNKRGITGYQGGRAGVNSGMCCSSGLPSLMENLILTLFEGSYILKQPSNKTSKANHKVKKIHPNQPNCLKFNLNIIASFQQFQSFVLPHLQSLQQTKSGRRGLSRHLAYQIGVNLADPPLPISKLVPSASFMQNH